MPALRKKRRSFLLLLTFVAMLVAVLWYWRPWQCPIVIHERINPKDGAAMVWVPAGSFNMGSNVEDIYFSEYIRYRDWPRVGDTIWRRLRNQTESIWAPEHRVSLDGYWIYRYEVTVKQYLAFCAAKGRNLPPFPSGYSWAGKSGWTDPVLQRHPIVNVTWHDAKAYADWAGVSLPTEAQWEYAARGPEGRNYPWGGKATLTHPFNGWDQSKCANANNALYKRISTWPLGSFPTGASWCGAHDMAGNVWEWCADWYGPYAAATVTNPVGPATGNCRILRGGSWRNLDFNCMSAFRNYGSPNKGDNNRGFRCVSHFPEP
jgi:formylglycine-generating enzyme required for sulfatase activity